MICKITVILAVLGVHSSATKTKEYPDMPKAKTAEEFLAKVTKMEEEEAGNMADDDAQMMQDSTKFLEQFLQNDADNELARKREIDYEVEQGKKKAAWIQSVAKNGYDVVNGQKVYMLDAPVAPPDHMPDHDSAKWYKDMMLDPMLHAAMMYNKKEEAAALIEQGNKKNRVQSLRTALKAAPKDFHKALLLWKEASKEHFQLLFKMEQAEEQAQEVVVRASKAQKQLSDALKGASNPQSLVAMAQNAVTAGLVQDASKESGLAAGMGALHECAKEYTSKPQEHVLAGERCMCISSGVCRMADAPGLCGTFVQTACMSHNEL